MIYLRSEGRDSAGKKWACISPIPNESIEDDDFLLDVANNLHAYKLQTLAKETVPISEVKVVQMKDVEATITAEDIASAPDEFEGLEVGDTYTIEIFDQMRIILPAPG